MPNQLAASADAEVDSAPTGLRAPTAAIRKYVSTLKQSEPAYRSTLDACRSAGPATPMMASGASRNPANTSRADAWYSTSADRRARAATTMKNTTTTGTNVSSVAVSDSASPWPPNA